MRKFHILILVALLLFLTACDSSSGGGLLVSMRSAELTQEAIDPIFAGGDDFDAAIAKLDEAIQDSPGNYAAKFFKALFEYLEFKRVSLLMPGSDPDPRTGVAYTLFDRSGVDVVWAPTNVLWDVQFVHRPVPLGEGKYPDTMPTQVEYNNYLRNYELPETEKLAQGMVLSPFRWTFQVPVNLVLTDFEVDDGDAAAIEAAARSNVSCMRYGLAYDESFDFNVIDTVGFSEEERTDAFFLNYGATWGSITDSLQLNLSADWAALSGDALIDAGDNFSSETDQQRQMGILTHDLDLLETQEFDANFPAFRTAWTLGGRNALFNPTIEVPLDFDGVTVDVSPGELYNNDYNEIYVSQFVHNPATGLREFGAEDYSEYADMGSVGGVIKGVNGVSGGATSGDLQAVQFFWRNQFWDLPGVPLFRLNGVSEGNITLDGDIPEWATNRDVLHTSNFLTLEKKINPPFMLYGRVGLNRDSYYVAGTRSPAQVFPGAGDQWNFSVGAWDANFNFVGSGFAFWDGATQQFQSGGSGISVTPVVGANSFELGLNFDVSVYYLDFSYGYRLNNGENDAFDANAYFVGIKWDF